MIQRALGIGERICLQIENVAWVALQTAGQWSQPCSVLSTFSVMLPQCTLPSLNTNQPRRTRRGREVREGEERRAGNTAWAECLVGGQCSAEIKTSSQEELGSIILAQHANYVWSEEELHNLVVGGKSCEKSGLHGLWRQERSTLSRLEENHKNFFYSAGIVAFWYISHFPPNALGSTVPFGSLVSYFGDFDIYSRPRWGELIGQRLPRRLIDPICQLTIASRLAYFISKTMLSTHYANQGRWKEAEELEVKVMETTKRILGEEHPDTLTSMANLASTCRNQGRWKETEELNVAVMETTKRMLGEEHPFTLTGMANLAFIWKAQGRNAKAVNLLEQCIHLRSQILGVDHPHTISSSAALTEWQR